MKILIKNRGIKDMIVLDNVIHENVFEKCKENLLGPLKKSTREMCLI